MERVLLGTNLWIEQSASQAFNLDTILLANFVKIPVKSKTVLEIGAGAGALLLYLSKKTQAKIIGVEIQEQRYLQAVKNIKRNNLDNRVSCINKDIKAVNYENIDCIVSNPPFFKVNKESKLNKDQEDTIARHEVMLSLHELVLVVTKFLKFGGHFFMIHRPDRFAEIIEVFAKHKLVVKRIQFVHPYLEQKANHVLIEAIKNGQPGTVLEPPLIIYEAKHVLTKKMIDIYGGNTNVT